MSAPEEFTGERYLPGVVGEIAYEHCHRYAFARRFVAGRRVLDAACGEGYGAALLADVARHVVGVDIDAAVVASASSRYVGRGNLEFRAASVTALPLADASVDAACGEGYGAALLADVARHVVGVDIDGVVVASASSRYVGRGNLEFRPASVTALPLADASVDVVVSFETIEHLEAADQPAMLAEFARVLTPDGILILSSPNRPEYSDARGYANPFHRAELDRAELAARLGAAFPAQRWFGQRRYMGSAIWGEGGGERYEALSGSPERVREAAIPTPLYFVVIAARNAAALPHEAPALSLYADGDDSEWARVDREAREVLRLDADLREQHREAQELRAMVEYRDRKLAERERAYAELESVAAQERAAHQAERERLMRQIEAQERVVAYRASVRWWFLLPFVRARRVWTRIRAA